MASASRAADDGVHLFAETSSAAAQSVPSTPSFQQQQHHHHQYQHVHHDYRLLEHPVNFDPIPGSSSSFYHYGAMNSATASSSTAEENQPETGSSAPLGVEGSDHYNYYGKLSMTNQLFQ